MHKARPARGRVLPFVRANSPITPATERLQTLRTGTAHPILNLSFFGNMFRFARGAPMQFRAVQKNGKVGVYEKEKGRADP